MLVWQDTVLQTKTLITHTILSDSWSIKVLEFTISARYMSATGTMIKSTVVAMCLTVGMLTWRPVFACEDLPWKRKRPYDYYAAETKESTGTFNGGLLYLVEQRHFPVDVQLLTKGSTGAQPTDLLFVLTSIPNHPGALDAYSRYELRYNKSDSFKSDKSHQKPLYQADCFFRRAIQIYPNYAETWKVWGLHNYRNGDYTKAIEMFMKSMSMGDTSPTLHYYLGLSYLSLGNEDEAVLHAKIAYSGGFPLQGLKNRLGNRLD